MRSRPLPAGRQPRRGRSAGSRTRNRLPRICAALGIPHPAFRADAAARSGELGGQRPRAAPAARISGGANGQAPASDRYFQRFVPGRRHLGPVHRRRTTLRASSASAGNGRRRRDTRPTATAARCGCGASPTATRRRSAAGCPRLARRAGLVGLCSADLIRGPDGYRLVEINPRPGATLDIFDSPEAPLMEAHLRAARGERLRIAALHRCAGVDDRLCVPADDAFSRACLARMDGRPSTPGTRLTLSARRPGLHGRGPRRRSRARCRRRSSTSRRRRCIATGS